MAWRILALYYIEGGTLKSQTFSSNGQVVFPDSSSDGADTRTWPPIEGIYRIVYYPLAKPTAVGIDPSPLLVLDVMQSRLTFSSKEGIGIVAWIYTPLAKNFTVVPSARAAKWETIIKDGAPPDYTVIKLWDGLDLTKNVPNPTAGAKWSDKLVRFLNGNREATGSVLVGSPPHAWTYSYSQTLGFPSFFLEGVEISDELKTIKLKVPTDCNGYWTTRAFFVNASGLLGDKNRTYFVAIFRLDSPNGANGKCNPTETGFTAFGGEDDMSFTANQWTIVHRPAAILSADAGTGDLPATQASLLHIFRVAGSSVAPIWNRWAQQFYQALSSVSGGQPVSFLPTFQNPVGEASQWVMTYQVTAYLADFALKSFLGGRWLARNGGGNHFYAGPYGDASISPPNQGVVLQPLSLHLETPESEGGAAIGNLELKRVFDVYGSTISGIGVRPIPTAPRGSIAGLGKLGALDQVESIYGIVLKYAGAATVVSPSSSPPSTRLVRMGSLDLALGGSRSNDSDKGDENWIMLRKDQGLPSVHVDARLVVSELLPGGQDDPPGEEYVPAQSYAFGANPCAVNKYLSGSNPALSVDGQVEARFRRKRPLVIHVGPNTKTDGLYTLQVSEDVAPQNTRAINVTVYSQNEIPTQPAQGDICDLPDLRRALILDRNPFLVAEVLYRPFEYAGQNAGSIIAVWNNTNPGQGPSWSLQFNQDPFCLVMPPQGIGEEMVKGHMPDRPDFPDPKTSALPFRFSGNARLTVDPRKQLTSLSEAPWNLRRILGTPQDPLPGPMVKRMQYELLYGLSCDITQPAFRLADLIARVGRIPGRRNPRTVWTATSSQTATYDGARLAWADIYSQYLSRVAVLEPWNGIINSTTSSVSLKEGLSCVIRSTADLANPITPEANRLRGGVTWGFESKNIYDQVMSYNLDDAGNPKTTAASLESFSISTLGGWGKQTAEFLRGGQRKIYADVEMGRTSTYKLDRLGRIAAWWVAAKHVIVYQRSVTPSRQFFNKQPQYAGWPVPRKVEEYVEILEDARPYPDNTGLTDPQQLRAAQQACGPVTSILLKKGMRFNVDFAWGSDVNHPDATGWKIPLWAVGAWPPDVYPKPAIGIGTAVADGTSGVKQPPVCDNPENLFFFTLTGVLKDGKISPDVDPDPHAWPPVLDVDYVNAPTPQKPDDFANADLRQTVPQPSSVPASFGPTTFRLRPGAAPTNLMANRASKQMAVVLETITVSRAVSTGVSGLSGAVATVQQVQQETGNLYARLLRTLPRDPSVSLNSDVWKDLQTAVTGPAQTVTNSIASAAQTVANVAQKIKNDATAFEQGLRDNFKANLATAVASALSDYKKYVAGVTTFDVNQAISFLETTQRSAEEALLFPSSTPGSLASMVARFVDAAMAIKNIVEQAAGAFNNALAQWQTSKDAAIRNLNNALLQAISVADALKTLRRPLDSLPDLYAWASSQLGAILTGIEPASKTLLDTLNTLGPSDAPQAKRALQTFQSTTFYSALSGTLPGNVKALVTSAFPGETIVTSDDVYQTLHKVDVWIHGFPKDTLANNKGQLALWANQCQTIKGALKTLQDLQNSVGLLETHLTVTLQGALATLLSDVQKQADAVTALFNQEMMLMQSKLQASVNDLVAMLTSAGSTGIQTIDALRKEIEKRRDDLSRQAEAYLDKGFRQLADSTAYQTADATFRLVRSFGAPPQVPNLGFDRDKIAYYFQQVDPQVNLTPVLARVTQAAQAFSTLQTLGATIPALGALEQLIPSKLEGFGLSDIFPNFAGLNLANLFSGLTLPSLDTKAVKITHDFDPQTLRATVNADINFTITDSSTLFTIGPVAVQVLGANFVANASLAADKTGIVRRTASGTISGDWQLSLSGAPFVLLKKTDLTFDDSGSIKFSVKPQNVVLPGALEVVTGLLNKFVSPDSGLTFGMLNDGFQAILALPVPDIQGVTSGFSNLKLGALFTIEVTNGFTMGVGFSLASKDAPFSLTIFVLGGGGYVSARANYTPSAQKLGCQVDMAITASASLAISLAVISGGVYVYFGATASYNTDGQGLTFGVMFLIRGEVSILGIVSAAIILLLEATYSGGTLTGRGQLSIKIQICWCFTLEVNESVSYTLGKQDSSSHAYLETPGPLLAAIEPSPFEPVRDVPQNPAAAGTADIFDTRAAEYVGILI